MLFALQTAVSQAPVSWSQDAFLIKTRSSSRCDVVVYSDSRRDTAPDKPVVCCRDCGAACQILYAVQNRAFLRTGPFYTTEQFFSFPRTALYILWVLWCSLANWAKNSLFEPFLIAEFLFLCCEAGAWVSWGQRMIIKGCRCSEEEPGTTIYVAGWAYLCLGRLGLPNLPAPPCSTSHHLPVNNSSLLLSTLANGCQKGSNKLKWTIVTKQTCLYLALCGWMG